MAKPLFDEAAPIFLKIILKFSGIKQTAPSSENWRSFIKWNFLVRPGLRKKMLRNLSFDINWDPFSVVIGGCWEFLSNKNCSLKDALQLGQTRFWFRPPKNCLGFKPVVWNHYFSIFLRYPEYYKVITEPIDLKIIAGKIVDNKYEDLNKLEDDIGQMCKNAQMFNEPGSQIYRDARVIMKTVKQKKFELEAARVARENRGSRSRSRVPNIKKRFASDVSWQSFTFRHIQGAPTSFSFY